MTPYRRMAAALAASLAMSAGAAAAAYPPALHGPLQAGMQVVKSFPAASGLTGWVLAGAGQYKIVYTTADRKTLVSGPLLDERGTNLSAVYEDRFMPKADVETAFRQIGKMTYVTEGARGLPKGLLYVFVDPNCGYCHLAWRALQAYETAGLQVRWIPVATLGPTSLPKAVEVLAASDRLAAFRQMQLDHGKPWQASGKVAANRQAALEAALGANAKLMEAFGVTGVPGVVWRDKAGRVQVKSGLPKPAELAQITGMPAPQAPDAGLGRYR